MSIIHQLLIFLRAFTHLLWLIVQQVAIWIWMGGKYIYAHRSRIARHRLTVPALIALSVLWSGYSVYQYSTEPVSEQIVNQENTYTSINASGKASEYSKLTAYSPDDSGKGKYVLIQNVYDWLGTPHRDGGRNKAGTDCSGFVQAVYKDAYNIDLSRNSSEIYENDVEAIAQSELQEGDLVFFRTHGKSISHVGIYLRNGMFAHTSSSRGVIVDSMNDKYFKKRYIASGRVKVND